ncbi:MAG: alkaline phosphatase family protein [Nitrososphaerales archaeon]
MKSNVLTILLILFMLISTTDTFSNAATGSNQIGGGQIKHVIIIVEENEAYNSIVNSTEAPYQNQLIRQYALAGNYFSPESPSLPNYLDLTAGSDMGISTDCSPSPSCQVTGRMTNIADLLNSSNLSWKEYAESMPAPCYFADSGNYAVRHNPFAYYTDITGNSAYCDQHVVPMNNTTGLVQDLQSGSLPNFSFVTPNLCDDGHDSCNSALTQVKQADNWLSLMVPKIIESPEFSSTVLFIVYDEGSTSPSSQVVCIVVSPFVRTTYVSNAYYTHFSLLATIENIFGLSSMGRNDSKSAAMSDMFASGSSDVTQSNSSSASMSSSTKSGAITPAQSAEILIVVALVASVIVLSVVKRKRLR